MLEVHLPIKSVKGFNLKGDGRPPTTDEFNHLVPRTDREVTLTTLASGLLIKTIVNAYSLESGILNIDSIGNNLYRNTGETVPFIVKIPTEEPTIDSDELVLRNQLSQFDCSLDTFGKVQRLIFSGIGYIATDDSKRISAPTEDLDISGYFDPSKPSDFTRSALLVRVPLD